jgi:hypothetical protein
MFKSIKTLVYVNPSYCNFQSVKLLQEPLVLSLKTKEAISFPYVSGYRSMGNKFKKLQEKNNMEMQRKM